MSPILLVTFRHCVIIEASTFPIDVILVAPLSILLLLPFPTNIIGFLSARVEPING